MAVGLWLVSAAAVAAPRSRIAVVVSDELEAYRAPTEAFLSELGQTPLVFNLHGRKAEADQVVATLKKEDPAVVFCVGAKAAWAVKNAMPSTPVVYAAVLDPARYGLAGSQVTGVTMDVEPVTFLSQFVGFFPDIRKIGVIRGPDTPPERLVAMAEAAAELGLESLVVREVDASRQVRGAFLALADQQVDALWIPPDRTVLTSSSYRTVTEEARRRQLPLLVDTANMVEAGGLFTVVPDAKGVGRQAAELVRKLADGAAPSVFPPEDPKDLLVVLNLRTVESAQLPFDRLLLDFVDVVVE